MSDRKAYMKEYNKKYYEKNKDKLLENMKKWQRENREKVYEYNRLFQKTDKGKASKQRRKTKRRTRERKLINTLTAQEWADILEAHNCRCAYCDVEFEVEDMPQKDHIIPLIKGGHNTKENIVPACKSCNSKKGIKIYK